MNLQEWAFAEAARVLAPGRATIAGSGTGLSGAANCYVTAIRTDGGFSWDVTVVQTAQTEDWS